MVHRENSGVGASCPPALFHGLCPDPVASHYSPCLCPHPLQASPCPLLLETLQGAPCPQATNPHVVLRANHNMPMLTFSACALCFPFPSLYSTCTPLLPFWKCSLIMLTFNYVCICCSLPQMPFPPWPCLLYFHLAQVTVLSSLSGFPQSPSSVRLRRIFFLNQVFVSPGPATKLGRV